MNIKHLELLADYLTLLNEEYGDDLKSEPELTKCEFLSHSVFGFSSYDGDIDEKWIKIFIDVCVAISERKTFDYIGKSCTHYEQFILTVNMPFFDKKLEWGTSIRGAWWRFEEDFYLQWITADKAFDIKEWNEFVYAMRDFVSD